MSIKDMVAQMELMTYGRVSKEVCLLAIRQRKMLKRKFPDYDYTLYEYPKYWLRLEISRSDGAQRGRIFTASFSSDSIKITCRPHFGLPDHENKFTEVIPYHDPRFTNDMLSDTQEWWWK